MLEADNVCVEVNARHTIVDGEDDVIKFDRHGRRSS
jgi:hypothetical protein